MSAGKISSAMLTLWPALRKAFPQYAITGYYDTLQDGGIVNFRPGSVRADIERVVVLHRWELEEQTTEQLIALVTERYNNPTN